MLPVLSNKHQVDNSLPKIHRISSPKDFESLKVDNFKLSNKPFIIYYKLNNLSYSRVSVSISSKVFNSVMRHKLKRLVREVFRKRMDLKTYGVDLLVVVLANTFNSHDFFAKLNQSFDRLLEKK